MKYSVVEFIFNGLMDGKTVSITSSNGKAYEVRKDNINGQDSFCRKVGNTTRKYSCWIKLLDSFSRTKVESVKLL